MEEKGGKCVLLLAFGTTDLKEKKRITDRRTPTSTYSFKGELSTGL